MTDDIVQRLRMVGHHHRDTVSGIDGPANTTSNAAHEATEAADEIERLRGRLDASEEAAAAHHAEWRECEGVIVEQKAEIERLRAENERLQERAYHWRAVVESLKAQLDASYAGRWG